MLVACESKEKRMLSQATMLADAHISSLGYLCSHLMRYAMNMFDHVHVRASSETLKWFWN